MSDRPSERSTVKPSSVTVTEVANTDRDSVVEVVIPSVQQLAPAPFHNRQNSIDLASRKTAASFQKYGIKPKLRFAIISFDVNVRRFLSVARIEEEAIWSFPVDGRHKLIVTPKHDDGNILRAAIDETFAVEPLPLFGWHRLLAGEKS